MTICVSVTAAEAAAGWATFFAGPFNQKMWLNQQPLFWPQMCPTHDYDWLTDWLSRVSFPRVCSQHVSTPPSHNIAVISLNANRVEKQEFEEAGLFLNARLLLFPSLCRVSVRGTLIFKVKPRYCVYRSNWVCLCLRGDDLLRSVFRQSQAQHASSSANSSLLQTSLKRKLSVCCLTI